MRKLLIAIDDDVLQRALTAQLRREYDITVCADGGTAADLLRSLRPDALILELMLPVKDGLYILEECSDVLPSAIMCVCDFCNEYIAQTATDLGVDFIFRRPCQPRAVAVRLAHLMNFLPAPDHRDWQNLTGEILLKFQFTPKHDGFRFLKVGIPLYAQDPQQRICKELYVSIASICGAGSWSQVERSIRSAIDAAWHTGSDAWKVHFPDAQAPPTGKTLISRLSQLLTDS